VPFLPVFDWLQRTGGIAEGEMLRTFNCGIGMIAIVEASDAKHIAASLTRSGEKVIELGTTGRRKAPAGQVVFSGSLVCK
jgi:phosphoribosylformylglycinamidine cyclo-ligase